MMPLDVECGWEWWEYLCGAPATSAESAAKPAVPEFAQRECLGFHRSRILLMPGGFGDELKSRLPQLALQILAGLQGPQALGALNQGMGQSQDRAQALARQAQMDEERRAQQQAVADRAAADDTRADEAAKFARLNAALGTLDRFSTGVGETATDPVAAGNQVLQRATGLEGAMGLPHGQLSPFVPNMS